MFPSEEMRLGLETQNVALASSTVYYLCMVITKSIDQPDKVDNPARGYDSSTAK